MIAIEHAVVIHVQSQGRWRNTGCNHVRIVQMQRKSWVRRKKGPRLRTGRSRKGFGRLIEPFNRVHSQLKVAVQLLWYEATRSVWKCGAMVRLCGNEAVSHHGIMIERGRTYGVGTWGKTMFVCVL